jgi:hypothetical protein
MPQTLAPGTRIGDRTVKERSRDARARVALAGARPLLINPASQLDTSALVIEAAGRLPTRFDVVAPLGLVALAGPPLERVA